MKQANGLPFCDGNWKYIEPAKGVKLESNTNTETGVDPEPQLYDLATDLGETTNSAATQAGGVRQMAEALKTISDVSRL